MAKNYTPAENYFCIIRRFNSVFTRPFLKDKDMLEELVDSRLEGKYPKEDFIRVCNRCRLCCT
ncbi:unnamed protein product [Brassica oleracea]